MLLILFQLCQRHFVSRPQKLLSPYWLFQNPPLLKYFIQKFQLLLVQVFLVSLFFCAQDLLLSQDIQFVLLQVLSANDLTNFAGLIAAQCGVNVVPKIFEALILD